MDDLFADLPPDPYEASFVLLQRVEKSIAGQYATEVEYSEACGVFAGFWEANGWKIPDPLQVSRGTEALMKSETEGQTIERVRGRFRLQFESYRNQILSNRQFVSKRKAAESIQASVSGSPGYAVLTQDEKKEIHKHLNKIRKIIEESQLDDGKKNALYSALSGLSSEVDRSGTRTDRFFSFMSEVGFYLGKFAKDAKPLFDEVKDVIRIVTRARARNEELQLPKGDEVLSLPEPKP